MLSKFLDPQNDFAFKKIFGTPQHKDILIHFLNDMIDFQDNAVIENVEFLNPVRDPNVSYAKQSIVDVLCSDQKGRKYIVEMQVVNNDHFVKRAQYYAAKTYCSQINRGEKYQNLKEIIFIAIANFIMFPDKSEYKSDHVILDKNSFTHDLKDFYFCFLELPKFKKKMNELSTMIEKWAYFFKYASRTSELEQKKFALEDPVIGQAFEALNQFSWSPEEILAYEDMEKKERDAQAIIDAATKSGLEQGQAMGQAIGETIGEVRGIKKASIEIAKKMLASGMFNEKQVFEITGLSHQEIEDIEVKIN